MTRVTETVGFLGLGTMGAGMVRNLMKAGHTIVGYNRSVAKSEALVADGMQLGSSPQDVASRSTVVIVCVSDDDAVRSLCLGKGGSIESLKRGGLFIDCGTTSLELTQELASACTQQELGFVDAPITGSKLGAAGGNLTIMVGGERAFFERAKPLFEAMGRHTVHVGEDVGAGQRAKFCLNMTQAVVLQGVLEGYGLANRLGVPIEKMQEIFENSAGKTGVGSFKTPYLREGDFTPHFRLALMNKDLGLALGAADDHGATLPAAAAVKAVYDAAMTKGLGDQDFLATAKILMQSSDIDFS